ncbi:MAG: adenosylhomocysteinase [Acidimicrobiia bacterium]|nr:adenosylhomocysteinase [Acidimicrobiia bacterium]
MVSERVVAEGRIAWARRRMPVLGAALAELGQRRVFDGLTIGFRLHLEPKTAVLVEGLLAGGARVVAMGNEGTTQFGTAEALADRGCEVLDRPGDGRSAVRAHLSEIAAAGPDLVLDNGAELIEACIRAGQPPKGATEETTSGAFRLREALTGAVGFPVIVINDSPLKAIVENKHGVGESVVDAIVRATNMSLHKKRVVVFGYGWCGRGIALYARHRGADVVTVEPDPVKALEAAMDGFDAAALDRAVRTADVVITATGRERVVGYELIEAMPDGALLANAGHTDAEIDVLRLELEAPGELVAPSLHAHELPGGRTVFLLAKGRIVNLAAAGGTGNPIEAMDLGLTLQARSLAALATSGGDFRPGPQPVPRLINDRTAIAMLESMGQAPA